MGVRGVALGVERRAEYSRGQSQRLIRNRKEITRSIRFVGVALEGQKEPFRRG